MFNQPLAVVGALPNNRVVVINIFSSSYKISGWVWNIRGYTAEIVAVARIVGSSGSGALLVKLRGCQGHGETCCNLNTPDKKMVDICLVSSYREK